MNKIMASIENEEGFVILLAINRNCQHGYEVVSQQGIFLRTMLHADGKPRYFGTFHEAVEALIDNYSDEDTFVWLP